MNNDIKEILDYLDKVEKDGWGNIIKDQAKLLTQDEVKTLLDYITNLQEENKKLNNIIDELYDFIDWHYKDNQIFYKNKGIGLNYPECDYVLNKLKELRSKEIPISFSPYRKRIGF